MKRRDVIKTGIAAGVLMVHRFSWAGSKESAAFAGSGTVSEPRRVATVHAGRVATRGHSTRFQMAGLVAT